MRSSFPPLCVAHRSVRHADSRAGTAWDDPPWVRACDRLTSPSRAATTGVAGAVDRWQDGRMALQIAQDPAADQVLADNPFALLVGMMLDQRIA